MSGPPTLPEGGDEHGGGISDQSERDQELSPLTLAVADDVVQVAEVRHGVPNLPSELDRTNRIGIG
jgi:hypothetical protein